MCLVAQLVLGKNKPGWLCVLMPYPAFFSFIMHYCVVGFVFQLNTLKGTVAGSFVLCFLSLH